MVDCGRRERSAVQMPGLDERTEQEHVAKTSPIHDDLLSKLVSLLSDLLLSKAAGEQRLGFELILPAVCSLLGPSLRHQHMAPQIATFIDAVMGASSTGAFLLLQLLEHVYLRESVLAHKSHVQTLRILNWTSCLCWLSWWRWQKAVQCWCTRSFKPARLGSNFNTEYTGLMSHTATESVKY